MNGVVQDGKNGLQVIDKRIQEKYGGKFVHATFELPPGAPCSLGMFGALVIEGKKNGV